MQPPSTARDWFAWALAEHRAGRTARAQDGCRRALAMDPGLSAARFWLASTLLDAGDVGAAATVAARFATSGVDAPRAFWLQARLATARGDAASAHDWLVRLLAEPALDPAQHAEALLALGLALGDLGRPAEAFAAAADGKRRQRALHAGEALAREGEVAKLRRLGDWIAGQAPERWPLPRPEVAGAAAGHAFLFGFPRSGTTLLEQVLATHPSIVTLEEEATLATAFQAFLSGAGACDALMRLEADEAAAWAEHYWRGLRARGLAVAGRLFVDKQPAGTLYLPLIARLFPRARILFAVRDPRDVVLSCFRQPFGMNAMTYAFTDLAETATCYDACMRLAERARGRLPLAWTDVRHEALVEDFAGETGRVLAFLGLERHDGVTDFARAAASRTIRTPSATQVRAGLNRRGIGRWTQYRDDLAPVLPILAPWVERFGYPP